MSFDSLGLRAELLQTIHKAGYTTASPIQAAAIPVILKGKDVMASAETGTGKTAAFTLPMLDLLSATESRGKPRVRALVLTPTRELAGQVNDSVVKYGRGLSIQSTPIYGGVSMTAQFKALRRGVDILVATPGRLIDHLERGSIDLSAVEFIVLDEADRMLDMGFAPAMERIFRAIPKKRQTLLFSATFSSTIRGLAGSYLSNPEEVSVAKPNATAKNITQTAYKVDNDRKTDLLAHLFDQHDLEQVLVFTRTKRGADRLAKQLDGKGIRAAAIHGDKSQGQRNRALAMFKKNKVRTLVATDVAARGIDINQLSHVVNYELPDDIENYVHRIGRTGRAGKKGTAISLIGNHEFSRLREIEKLIKSRIQTDTLEGFEPKHAPVREAADPAKRRRNTGGFKKKAQYRDKQESTGSSYRPRRGDGKAATGNKKRRTFSGQQNRSAA
ncbi:MAG: DEAD/DEAH box helicase [Gammaproteobacteria bacterium]|nr:DEAD/DEAH box helicase [Gammaproteobacteria bacterium]